MSLSRRSDARGRQYRQGYLSSAAWRGFKGRYYGSLRRAGHYPVCQVCGAASHEGAVLDLHHLSYEGVSVDASGRWVSGESFTDVIVLCRVHHQMLHQRLDDYRRDFAEANRRRASLQIINSLKNQLVSRSAKSQRVQGGVR